MVQGSWVGAPALCSFLFFYIFHLFFIPYERISYPGWGSGWGLHPLCLDPFPFPHSSQLSFLLLSFLGSPLAASLVIKRITIRLLARSPTSG